MALLGKAALLSLAVAGTVAMAREVLLSAPQLDAQLGGTPAVENASSRFRTRFALVATGKADAGELPALARDALREEPLNAEAVLMLGDPRKSVGHFGKSDQARLDLAERINKRSLAVQMAQIESAVARNDIKAALVHYDRAMVANQRSVDIFLPVLTGALTEADIRAALVPYVVAGRWWTVPLLQHASGNAPPLMLADFFRRFGGGRRVSAARSLEKVVLKRLLDTGEVAAAMRYAATMKAGGVPGLERFGFNADSVDAVFGPLAWTNVGDGGVTAAFEDAGRVVIIAPPGGGGVALSRDVPTSAGSWTLSQTLDSAEDQAGNATWSVVCLNGPSETDISSETVAISPGSNTHRIRFDVPASCRALRFKLRVSGENPQLETRLTLSGLALTKG